MKKHRLLSLFLVLAMLAGCAPAAEPAASPSPSPVPTPDSIEAPGPEDFYEFLHDVTAVREAVTARQEVIDISAYTPGFIEQNETFSQEELTLLTTFHRPEEELSREDLLADAETFFTLLKTTYGAYYYFGGDETFLPLLDAVKEELSGVQRFTAETLEDILYKHLSPVLVDGHFLLGSHAMRTAHSRFMYYVPDLYLDSPEGVEDPAYVKPTIGPDGRICWWYAVLSDGNGLPEVLDGNPLIWKKALASDYDRFRAFSVSQWEGIPILASRRMFANQNSGDEEALQQFSACGGEYAGSPLLIFDVRGNPGGSDAYIMDWFRDWAGVEGQPRRSISQRYSQLSCLLLEYPAEHMGTFRVTAQTGAWVERSGPVFVLQDKGTASSGETAVQFFRTAAETLFVGGPTMGCALTPNNISLYLPHSGLPCYFGTGVSFCETSENQDGIGFLPDLWVEPANALNAVKALIEYYDLAEEG